MHLCIYDIHSVNVVVYGWYGQFERRDNYGELPASQQPSFIQYIEYNEELFEMIVQSNIFNPLTYRVVFERNVPTTLPVIVTEKPTTTEGISMVVILGVAVGGGLAALVIVLIIVLVIVFGRGRKKSTKKKSRRRCVYQREGESRRDSVCVCGCVGVCVCVCVCV